MTRAGNVGALLRPMTMSDARARNLGYKARRNREDGGKPALAMLPQSMCPHPTRRDWAFYERLETWAKAYGKEFSAYTAMEALGGTKHHETMRQALFLGPFRKTCISKAETPDDLHGHGRQMFIYDATMVRPAGSHPAPLESKVKQREPKPPRLTLADIARPGVYAFLEAHPGSTIHEIVEGADVDATYATVARCLRDIGAVERGWRQVGRAGRPSGIWFLNKPGA